MKETLEELIEAEMDPDLIEQLEESIRKLTQRRDNLLDRFDDLCP